LKPPSVQRVPTAEPHSGMSSSTTKGASFIEKRQEMHEMIEASQRATSEAIYQLNSVKREPVPYAPTMAAPILSSPIPTDSHLLRSADSVSGRGLPSFSPTVTHFAPSSHEKPWASFEQSQPEIFGNSHSLTTQEDANHLAASTIPPVNPDFGLTCQNEWNLAKEGYNPDVAAHMRINVRKSALLAMKIQANIPKEQGLYSSHNVKAALGQDTVANNHPARASLCVEQVFPR